MYLKSSRIVYSPPIFYHTSCKRKVLKIHSMKNENIVDHYKEQKERISKEISKRIPITLETCTNKSKLQECMVMWDEIEELSATLNDLKYKLKKNEN